jgi:hypothetical protein
VNTNFPDVRPLFSPFCTKTTKIWQQICLASPLFVWLLFRSAAAGQLATLMTEISSPNLIVLKELNKNQILCGQSILGQDHVIFTIKGRTSGVKERKNSCELDFSSPTRRLLLSPNYSWRRKSVPVR